MLNNKKLKLSSEEYPISGIPGKGAAMFLLVFLYPKIGQGFWDGNDVLPVSELVEATGILAVKKGVRGWNYRWLILLIDAGDNVEREELNSTPWENNLEMFPPCQVGFTPVLELYMSFPLQTFGMTMYPCLLFQIQKHIKLWLLFITK